MAKKGLRFISAAFLLTALVLLILLVSSCKEKTAFEKTLEKIKEIDKKYSIDQDDYKYGMDYLRYHPRFPKPTNDEDIPGIVKEFDGARQEALDDKPSVLLLDGRIHMMEAEKFYKLSIKFPLKGSVEDGFSCNEADFIKEAALNLNLSVYHGRIAVESMNELLNNYKTEASMADITHYWMRSVNKSFDDLEAKARKSVNVINHFCLNETTEEDAQLEEEYGRVTDMMKEAQQAAIGRATMNRTNATNNMTNSTQGAK